MGALGVTGKTSGEEHIDPVEPEQAEGAAPSDEGFVPAAQLVPETQASRRERLWKERVEGHLAPIKEEWNKKEQTYQQQLEEERRQRQEQAQMLARLQGQFEAMQRQPQAVQQVPSRPDPAKLYEEAEAALANNDIRGYHAKNREAMKLEAEALADSKISAVRAELQKQIPPQMPPHIQQLMFQNPAVAAAGERGVRALIRMEQELEDEGVPPGYARTKQAFEAVNAKLAKPKAQPRQQFSQESAAALSGIPTARASTGTAPSSEEGVRLNDAQKAAMKAGGFKSAEEYMKWTDPHKYGLVKS